MAAIIKQAWVDVFAGRVKDTYAQEHRNRNLKEAVMMFEGGCTNEWRKSLAYLAEAIHIDDLLLVEGYQKYKRALNAGKKKLKPAEAFDVLLKILINGKGDTR